MTDDRGLGGFHPLRLLLLAFAAVGIALGLSLLTSSPSHAAEEPPSLLGGVADAVAEVTAPVAEAVEAVSETVAPAPSTPAPAPVAVPAAPAPAPLAASDLPALSPIVEPVAELADAALAALPVPDLPVISEVLESAPVSTVTRPVTDLIDSSLQPVAQIVPLRPLPIVDVHLPELPEPLPVAPTADAQADAVGSSAAAPSGAAALVARGGVAAAAALPWAGATAAHLAPGTASGAAASPVAHPDVYAPLRAVGDAPASVLAGAAGLVLAASLSSLFWAIPTARLSVRTGSDALPSSPVFATDSTPD